MTTSYCLMVTRFILIVTLVSFLNNQRSNPSMESGPFGYTWTCQEQEDTTRRGFLDNGIVPLPPLLLLPLHCYFHNASCSLSPDEPKHCLLFLLVLVLVHILDVPTAGQKEVHDGSFAECHE